METLEGDELASLAKAGDIPAFEMLYRRYNDRIYNFAKQITGSAEDAADVAQETFIRAWSALPRLKRENAFAAWLYRIALNLSKDVISKRGMHSQASLDSFVTDAEGESAPIRIVSELGRPEDALVTHEVQASVRKAIQSLSPDQQAVVVMHHMEGMAVETIAKVLGIPKGTVMSRLSRAREVLKRKLIPYIEEEP